MATQFIKNNTNFEAMNNWNGFNGIVEKDGFKSLNLKQTNANYTGLVELQEESTYTLWCEIKSMYLQQISTIKGLLFDCFFVKEDGSYEETIYDACSDFEVVSQERTLQPDKWQVIELRVHTKSLSSAKDGYTRIMFRPKFEFNEDEENGIDIYIKNVSFEDTDRRYFGNNLLVDSSKCEDEIYKLDNVKRTDYRYYGGYIFETTDIKGSVAFNVAKELFKRRILRNGDKVRYSMFVRTTSESIKYPNLSFYMKRYNINTQEDTNMYFFRSEFVGQITNEWQKMSYDFTVTSQMIDDSGNNLLWGDTGFFFSGQLNDSGVIYYACPMLEIIGDDDIVRNEWVPHKRDELYLEYWKDLIMCYVETDKLVSVFMRKKGEDVEKEISNFVTSYTESNMSSSDKKVSIGNVGSKAIKIGLRNYDDDGVEILPRDLTNYIFYIDKYFKNDVDDSGDIQFREGKYLVYENPEDFSSNMTLEIQDRMVELDVAYTNELDLPTNVRTQLENIAYLSNMKVDYTDIDETLLNEEVNFYDESYTRRNYLSWIGERASCNLYMNDDTITFKKINKNEHREQYMDYVSQSARLTDKFYLNTVIFDNTIQYYVQSNDLFFNDETIFEIKKDKEDYQNYVNTNVKATLESGKTYTFDFVSNKEKVGEDNDNVKAILKSPSGNNDVDIDAFAKTFVANESGEYTLYFYFYTDVLNDFATFSNFHVVEGKIEYNITNTLYVNNENMYISKYENLDYIYKNLSGLELMGFSGFKLILGNPRIKSNDLVYFRFIDEMDNESFNNVPFVSYIDSHELTYNKSYTSKLEASIESTNDEKLNSYATSTSARMKRLKVEVDNNSQSISIIGQDIVEVKNDIDLVEERVNTAEIKLQPENIVLSVNQGLLDGSVIRGTKFEIDVDGVHISGGGLDIKNNSGTKVFYADTNGNLTIVNLTATSGTFKGTISGSTISGTTISGGSISGTTISGSTISGTTITGGTINGTTITTDKNLYVGDNVYIGNQQSDIRKSIYMNENNYISFYNSAINLISGNSGVYVYNTTNAPTVDTGSTENGVFIQTKHPISFWAGSSEYASITITGSAGQSGFLNEIGLSARSRIYVQTYAFVISGSNMQGFTENASPYRNIWRPNSNGGAYLGTASYRWNTVFAVNGSINTSDLKYKNVLQRDMKSREFINSLQPISFTRTDKSSGGKRIHMGFGAQDVNKSIKTLGLGDLAIAQAVIVDGDQEIEYFGEEIDDSKLMWGLNYSEFIPPMVDVIQQHDTELEKLKMENKNLKSQLEIMNDKLEAVMRGDYEHNIYSN